MFGWGFSVHGPCEVDFSYSFSLSFFSQILTNGLKSYRKCYCGMIFALSQVPAQYLYCTLVLEYKAIIKV